MSDIQIAQFQIPDWQFGGSTAKLRLYSDRDFTDSLGVPHLHGTTGAKTGFFQEVACSVSGTTVTVPAFTTYSTTDAHSNRQARISGVLFDTNGAKREVLFSNFRIPETPTSTTWDLLNEFNEEDTPINPPDTYPTHAEVVIIAQSLLGELNDASTVIKGRTKLSIDPVVAANPIAVGANDYASTSRHGITKLSVAPVSATNPIAVGDNDPRLFGTNIINVREYGAACDGVTDDTAAIQAAFDAALNGTTVLFPGPCLVGATSGTEIFRITKSLILQGVGRISALIFKSTTPATVDMIRYNPQTMESQWGFTLRNLIFKSYDTAEMASPLKGNYHTPVGAGNSFLVIDNTGAITNYHLRRVLIEQCEFLPPKGLSYAIRLITAPATFAGVFAQSTFRNNVCYGGFQMTGAGDSIWIYNNFFSGKNPAIEYDPVTNATTLAIHHNSIISDGGIWIKRGRKIDIKSNIIENFVDWGSEIGHNGAVVDIDGTEFATRVENVTIMDNQIGSQDTANPLDLIRFNRAQDASTGRNQFVTATGKMRYNITSNAIAVNVGRDDDNGGGTEMNTLASPSIHERNLWMYLGLPVSGVGPAGFLSILGGARINAKDTASSAVVNINTLDLSQLAQLALQSGGNTKASITAYGTNYAADATLQDSLFINNLTATGSVKIGTFNTRRWEVNGSGHFVPHVANVYDIGESAKGSRTGYFGTSVVAPKFNFSTTITPSGTGDAQGSTGDMRYDANFIYIKTAAGWKRAALSTF